MPFTDRVDAGRRLGAALARLASEDVVVLGLPRGGVPVAFEVAAALNAPFDVLVVRKLGVPFQPELAMGAVGEGGVKVLNERVLAQADISAEEVAAVEQREREVVDRRVGRYRAGRTAVSLTGRTAIVVDDGIATGSTARAACQVARAAGAARVVLAVPVGPANVLDRLGQAADEVVGLETPPAFFAIGGFYRDFSQTSDEEVADLLARASTRMGSPGSDPDPDRGPRDSDVEVPVGQVVCQGHVCLPAGAGSLVVFAHGSGGSRRSAPDGHVAGVLQAAGIGTLMLDLLTTDEQDDPAASSDIETLARRLSDVTRWLRGRPENEDLSIGYFGSGAGAAAALCAAAIPGSAVNAVVSHAGRPELAGPWLGRVRAPTLLVVGEHDEPVLELNRRALVKLHCEVSLSVVPAASDLFEEPGTLATVARLARDWFTAHLTSPRADGVTV